MTLSCSLKEQLTEGDFVFDTNNSGNAVMNESQGCETGGPLTSQFLWPFQLGQSEILFCFTNFPSSIGCCKEWPGDLMAHEIFRKVDKYTAAI